MADFQKADQRTFGNEGYYSNDPRDNGGETWEGISRVNHPHWPGWSIIDRYKAQHPNGFVPYLKQDQQLSTLVFSFYKQGFWDVSQLDRFTSQWLAENVFDASVNCGAAMGPNFLQKCLNALKPYGLAIDNFIGNLTFNAMADALASFGESVVVNKYVDIREAYHRAIVANHPDQGCFLQTWISRCEGMREEVD